MSRSGALLVAVFSLVLLLSIVPTTSAPGTRWGRPVLIENAPGGAEYPQIAVDPSGNAIAVWDQFGSTHKDVWANRFDADTGWGTPVLLETDDAGDATGVQVAMSASGYAVAAWHQLDGRFRSNIWANVYSPRAGWGTATLVEFDDTGDASEPQVGMDSSGNALAIWVYFDGAVYSLASNTFVPGTGWGTPVPAESDSTGNVVTPHLAVNPAGNAVAVWTWDDWSWMNVWANTYEPGIGWANETLLETDNRGWAFDVEVAIDSAGAAMAVWSQNSDTPLYNLFANRFVPGTGWESPTLLENNDIWDALLPQVAFDASGAAIVVWEQYVGGNWQDIYGNRYAPGVGWEGVVLVGLGETGNAMDPQLAADPSGNVTAVWSQFDGGTSNIWANRYRSPGMGPLPPAAPEGVSATLPGGGQDVLVTWQASPDEGDPSVFDHYEILRGEAYDAKGAGYGVVAASLPTGTTSFADTATLPGVTHFYVVRAVGPGGATNAGSQAAKYVRALPSGRSLLGIPVAVQDYAVTAVLSSVLPVLDSVSAYLPSDATDPWKTWNAAQPAKELSILAPSTGFWVTLNGGAEWRIAGGVSSMTAVPLAQGWNLVPYPSFVDRPASVILAGLPITEVEGFDASAAPYYLRALAEDSILRAGEGYWLYASSATVWSVPN